MTQDMISFARPAKMLVRNVAGAPVYLDWAQVPDATIAAILVGGAKIILTNTYNGGGKDAAESEKLAQLEKRIAAWYRGEFVQIERGEQVHTAMKEIFIDEQKALQKTTATEIEKQIKATVCDVFGKDHKATFPAFLDAVATLKSKEKGALPMADIREKLEAKYAALVEAKRKETNAVAAKLDISGITF